jgi:hypothetical protein
LEAFTQGVGVTAKIMWLTQPDGRPDRGVEGRPRWIHSTPLIGSDSKVGVWMVGKSFSSIRWTERKLMLAVVMIEKEEITGSLNSHQSYGSINLSDHRLNGRSIRRSLSDKNEYVQYLRAQYLREHMDERLPAVSKPKGVKKVDSVRGTLYGDRPGRRSRRSSDVGGDVFDFEVTGEEKS